MRSAEAYPPHHREALRRLRMAASELRRRRLVRRGRGDGIPKAVAPEHERGETQPKAIVRRIGPEPLQELDLDYRDPSILGPPVGVAQIARARPGRSDDVDLAVHDGSIGSDLRLAEVPYRVRDRRLTRGGETKALPARVSAEVASSGNAGAPAPSAPPRLAPSVASAMPSRHTRRLAFIVHPRDRRCASGATTIRLSARQLTPPHHPARAQAASESDGEHERSGPEGLSCRTFGRA